MHKFINIFFDEWLSVLKRKDLEKLKKTYKETVFFATFSNKLRVGGKEAVEYFREFVKKNPQCKIVNDFLFISDDHTQISWTGFYEFEVDDENKKRVVKNAAFTFVFKYSLYTGELKLVHHHSSPR